MMINQIITTTTTTKKTVKAIWTPEMYKQNNSSKQTLQTTFTTAAEIQNDGISEQF